MTVPDRETRLDEKREGLVELVLNDESEPPSIALPSDDSSRAQADSVGLQEDDSIREQPDSVAMQFDSQKRDERFDRDAEAREAPSIDLRLAHYRALARIGTGGMGEVYKVVDETTDKIVAVKVIRPELIADARVLKRFQQEADAASQLTHANLAAVYAHGCTADGAPYLVMDFIEGISLSELLHKEGRLAPERALGLFVQIGQALAHAHRKGILHRDVKPSNIMITGSHEQLESIRVLDFGISKIIAPPGSQSAGVEKTAGEAVSARDEPIGVDADSRPAPCSANKLTQTAQVLGSPVYMSPEQCLGRPVDFRSDIYSFGCLMYETLTGSPPFTGSNAVQIIAQQVNGRADLSRVEAAAGEGWNSSLIAKRLADIIAMALEKEPDQRYQSMDDLRLDLLRVESGRAPRLRGAMARWLSCEVPAWPVGLAGVVAVCAFFFLKNWLAAPPPAVPVVNQPPISRPASLASSDLVSAAPVEIKATDGRLIFRSSQATTVRDALLEAMAAHVDLSYADLRHENLNSAGIGQSGEKGIVFDHVRLAHADFSGSSMISARFIGCDLRDANFTAAELRSGPGGPQPETLSRVSTDEILSLTPDSVTQSSTATVFDVATKRTYERDGRPKYNAILFKNCDARGARFYGAVLESSGIEGTNLQNASIRAANLSDSVLVKTDLQGAQLSGAKIDDLLLDRCNLTGTSFADAVASTVELRQTAIDKTLFRKAKIREILCIGDCKVKVVDRKALLP